MSAVARRPTTIDGYLAALPAGKRAALASLRKAIRIAVPGAEECISYGMPAFRVQGRVVGGFAATEKGYSYYPFSGSTLATLAGELAGYEGTKSAVHATLDHPLPGALVRKLIRARLAEIAGASRAGAGPRRLGGPPATNDVPLLVGPHRPRTVARKKPTTAAGGKARTRTARRMQKSRR